MRWHSIPTCLDRHVSVPYLGFLYCRSQAYCLASFYLRKRFSPVPLIPISRYEHNFGATGILWMSVALLLSTWVRAGVALVLIWADPVVLSVLLIKMFIWSLLFSLSCCLWLFPSAMFQIGLFLWSECFCARNWPFPGFRVTLEHCLAGLLVLLYLCTVVLQMNITMMSFLANHNNSFNAFCS